MRAGPNASSRQSLGIDRKTIAKYLAPAIAESLTPGGEPVTEAGVDGSYRPLVP